MTSHVDIAPPPPRLPRGASLAVGVALVTLLALAVRGIDVDATLAWLRDAGPVGALALAAAYVAATVTALPVAAMSMAAGWAYGVGWGMAVLVPVTLAAALAGLAVGRTLLRDRIVARVRRDRRFAAIDRAIGADGFRITLLVRLSPILPFGILNYALSATSVRPAPYAIATVIGIAPATLMYVYLGSLAGDASTSGLAGLVTWCGIGVTAIAVVVIARVARRALAGAGGAAS